MNSKECKKKWISKQTVKRVKKLDRKTNSKEGKEIGQAKTNSKKGKEIGQANFRPQYR